jgi:hypothetical protein
MTTTTPNEAWRGNRLLAVAADEGDDLGAEARVLEMKARAPLYEPDRRIEYVHFPITLVGSLVTVMADGTAVEIATTGNEGLVGLPVFQGADRVPGLAFVQVPGLEARVPAEAFREHTKPGSVLHGLVQRFSAALFQQIAQSVACNRLHPVEERASRWLLTTHDRVTSDTFPLTQSFLAQMLGVRRGTVNIAARMLQQAGLITYSRGIVTVRDRKGLEAASCECYEIVRSEYDRLLESYEAARSTRRFAKGQRGR